MTRSFVAAIRTGVLAILCVVTRNAAARGVPMTVELPSGGRVEYAFEDRDAEWLTHAGRLRFKPSALASITREPAEKLCRVTTTAGDVWLAELPAGAFRYFPTEDSRESVPFDAPFQRIHNTRATAPPAAAFAARIERLDGGTLFSDLRDVLLKVENDSGAWDFPVGACSSVTFSRQASTDTVLAEIKFGTGQIETLSIPGRRPVIRVADLFGNQLDLPVGNVRRITVQSPTGGEPDAPLRRLDGTAGRIFVAGTRGEIFTVSAPMIVWTLDLYGKPVSLPSNNLRSVRKNPAGAGFIVETVYGERFTGALRPEDVPLPRDRNDFRELRIDRQQSVSFLNAYVTIPAGYLAWRLRDGTAFCARLADGELRLTSANESGITRCAQSHITFLRGGTPLSIMRGDDDLVLGRPETAHAELVLLASSSTIRIPWSEIEYAMAGLATVSRELLIPSPEESSAESAETLLSRLFRTIRPTASTPGADTSAGATALLTLENIDFANEEVRRALEGGSPSDYVRHTLTLLDHAVSLYRQEKDGARERLQQAADEVQARDTRIGELTNTIAVLQTAVQLGEAHLVSLQAERDRDLQDMQAEVDEIEKELEDSRQVIVQLQAEKKALLSAVQKPVVKPARPASPTPPAKSGDKPRTAPRTPDMAAKPEPKPQPAPGPNIPADSRRVAARDPSYPEELLLFGSSFEMGRQRGEGRSDEIPAVTVTLAPFFITDHEVTRGEFARFVQETGYSTDAEEQGLPQNWKRPGFRQTDDQPVVCVSWFDAVQYCNWRSLKAGLAPCYELKPGQRVSVDMTRNGYRLPSEAEWEFAARNGGQDVLYPWGDDEAEAAAKANFRQEAGTAPDRWESTNPVKATPPNRIGLYGMAGNVWEWCSDWYVADAYATTMGTGNISPFVGDRELTLAGGQQRRSMRGGSFLNGLSMLRCACRGNGAPGASANRVGFRLARNASVQAAPQ